MGPMSFQYMLEALIVTDLDSLSPTMSPISIHNSYFLQFPLKNPTLFLIFLLYIPCSQKRRIYIRVILLLVFVHTY